MWSEEMSIGEIVYESPSTVRWKIGSWKMFEKELFEFYSPKFKFMDETWHLEIYTSTYNIHMGLYSRFEKDEPMIERRANDNIWFKLRLKASDGKECIIGNGILKSRSDIGFSCKYYSILQKFSLVTEAKTLATNSSVIVYFDLQTEQMPETEFSEGKEKIKGKDSIVEEQNKDDEGKDFHGTTAFVKMSQDFMDLLLTGEDSDMTVKINDTEFHVHKLILSARSPVFASMFKHDLKEKNTGMVEISDCAANAFYDFLLFLYSGKLEEFSREKVFDLYLAADKYDVKDLKSACVKFIEKDLCIDTICDALLIALRHDESLLLETICKFFAKNMKQIIITVKWQTFIKENPIECNELFIKALNIE